MKRKATNCHVVLRKAGEVEMSRGCVFIANLNIPEVFAVTQSAARFGDVYFVTQGTGDTVDEIGGNARNMIGGVTVRLVLHRPRAHLTVPVS